MLLPLRTSAPRGLAATTLSAAHRSARLASTVAAGQPSAPAKKTLAVLGGGISGLASAYRLSQRLPASRYRVVLLEQSQRLGGWIDSRRTTLASPPTDPNAPSTALIEKGPRSIRPTGPTGMVMLELLRSIDLLDRMLKVPKTAPSAQNRFIYYPDRLAKLPSSLPSLFTALAKLPFLRSALPRAALEYRVPSRFARPRSESKAEQDRLRRREALDDESVDSFVSRRFGEGLAANLVSAVIHGIYAGDSRKLSVRSVMPFLWEAERTHGSVLKSLFLSPKRNRKYRSLPEHEATAKSRREGSAKQVEARLGKELTDSFKGTSVYSFPNGLQEIIDALEQKLDAAANVEVRKGAGVVSVVVGEDGKVLLKTTAGDTIEADRVISALPSAQMAKALHAEADGLPGLEFNPSANVGVVNLVISPAAEGEASSSKPLLPVEGFGYLIPRTTPNNEDGILGVVFDSDSLPTQDMKDPLSPAAASTLAQRPIKLTVMMGGAHWSHLDAATLPTDDEMRRRAVRAVSQHLSIPASLLEDPSRTKILPTMQRDCIPQYLVGHPVRMHALHRALAQHETLSDKLTLVGASYTGVSLNDCVAYSIEAADRVADAELHGQGRRTRAVTGLENFDHAAAEPQPASAGSIKESVTETPPLSGAMQRMARSGQMWWQQAGRTDAARPAFARGLHTSSARSNDGATGAAATGSAATAKKPRPLGEVLAESIRASGPMPVSTYMRTCLLDPVQGYYSSANAEPTSADGVSREVLGSRGDFITSPEISQVFGELVAVFYVARWQACQMPRRTRLVELGPGKGTLLADMLRTFSVFPQFLDTVESIHLLETSEGLMKLQLEAVRAALDRAGKKLVPADQAEVAKDEIRIEWFNDIADIPIQPETFTILTAHEFFDALPTHIFEKTVNGFREVLVGVKTEPQGQKGITVLKPSDLQSHKKQQHDGGEKRKDELQFVLSPGPTPWSKLLAEGNKRFATLQPGQRIEVSPESWAIARRVGEIVSGRPASAPRSFASGAGAGADADVNAAKEAEAEAEAQRLAAPSEGGISLIIDYGGDQTYGGSLRAFKRHEIVDVFDEPGQCDLTVNVDFLHLKSAFETTEASYLGPMEQAHFLVAMGLEQRVERLRRDADEERKRQIEGAANRLVDLTGMGRQYKVLAVQADRSEGGWDEVEHDGGKKVRKLKTQPAAKLYPFEM
ncbi:uncharacterized protein PFL1_03901 [Pseudozyma flocculosa PF-1]|uniref:Related to HEM14 - Protoporphyrinogen oxidase involved in heme biosynthetic pathway n=2 Tax=Pseudozyma flocculosa TaxID=84751 RepID=A0A5C3EWE6_9BASI|nr:uncharacterized protein PFL1_03901 [Pseudozyma flocculosa PF-1]EPQ28598.1 hypothetical protein PFL1_03901 [Pseudozyma flocculosa PF-1]SPO36538.1 related to HEM14 - Protoporphyrinogen oxidase involved in heme biosynthetic pathway [Pseudozyma flocculosa]